jgi:hypothetical protein
MPLFGKQIHGDHERRFSLRESVRLAASILTLDRSYCATIENVSESGARLRGCGGLAPGEDLWIKVGCIDRLATVAWCTDDLCGVTFDTQLEHEDLVHLRCEARNTLVVRLAPEERLAAQEWINAPAR